MKNIQANKTLDAIGLACPMPIVKTKKAISELEEGFVLEVQATDKGSTADIKAWAANVGHRYLGTVEDGELLRHFLRKSPGNETFEKNHPAVIGNEALEEKINADEPIVVLDVREVAEYAFNHIPNAVSMPLGDLENRIDELNDHKEIYVICSTASRSDLAAQKLAAKGFTKVINVVPGMSEWTGATAGIGK